MAEITLTLYIAGGTVNSSRAQQNLQRALDQLSGNINFIIIDLLKEPERAANEGILVTPTLAFSSNNHKEAIIGTLDDTDELLQQLKGWFHQYS